MLSTLKPQKPITGTLTTDKPLIGTVQTTEMVLVGNLEVGKVILNVDVENYEGSYTVTPKVSEQLLETKQRLMTDDLTIKGIPIYEVSNSSGGMTVYIAKE